ncbi:MAG: tetratricopeptide repeat protein [bacterium]
MTNLFPTLCLFLFISSLIYILIYYTFSVSEYFSSSRYGKISIFYWSIIVILGSIFFVLKYSNPSCTQIGCFPLCNDNVEINSAVAERISFNLKRTNLGEKHTIIYSIENTFEIIDPDSAKHMRFLKEFGNSIDLDLLLLVDTRTVSDNFYVIDLSLIHYRKDKIQTFKDTLNFHLPQRFFTGIKNHFKSLFENDYSLNQNELFQTRDHWQKFGKGLYLTFKEKYIEADKIFHSLFLMIPDNISVRKQYASVLLQKALQFKSEDKFTKDIIDQVFGLLNPKDYSENDPEIPKLLGKMYVQNENWNFAALKLKQALKLNPNDPEIFFYLSKLHTSRLKKIGYTSKIEVLKKSIFFNTAYLTPHLKLAQIYLKRREFGKAKKVYNHILSINPRSVEALHGLGKMYLIQNRPVDFISTYKKILEIDPDNSIAFYNLGIAYLNTRNIERAESFFHRSVEIDNYSNSYFYLGVIYAIKKNPSKAIFYFSKSIESGKDDEYIQEARRAIKKLKNNDEIIHLRSFHGFGRQ